MSADDTTLPPTFAPLREAGRTVPTLEPSRPPNRQQRRDKARKGKG